MSDDSVSYATSDDVDVMFVLFCAILVFFMQAGFSMLEVGAVQAKNTKSILMKNTFDASIGIICWVFLGHGFAFGTDSGGFIGTDDFFFRDQNGRTLGAYDYAFFLFEWAFVATSATIVSGAVAERLQFQAYIIASICLMCIIYPLVAHWVWSGDGWLSAFKEDDLFLGCGVVDFAGSGVVHMLGGTAALMAVLFLEPRKGVTFTEDGRKVSPPGQSVIFQSLGTLVLWFGWFAFNGGSMLVISGGAGPVARAMVATAVAAGTSGVATGVLTYVIDGSWILEDIHNGLLAGLVSITANCSVVAMEGALIIGICAAPLYLFANRFLERMKIDDVISAVPVHGVCGLWGLIATGLFATPNHYGTAYSADRRFKCAGIFYGGDGNQLLANIIGGIVMMLWSAALSSLVYYILKHFEILRVPDAAQELGVDEAMHTLKHNLSSSSNPAGKENEGNL